MQRRKFVKTLAAAAVAAQALPEAGEAMEDQLAREAAKTKRNEDVLKQGETPQQKYNRLYRERPQNRTVWRKK